MPAITLRTPIARTILLLLSLIPLIQFAYLGSNSRLISDDYCHVDEASELGPIAGMAYWRNKWNGSYTDYFFHGLLAPLDEYGPAVFPAAIVVALLIALSALIYQVSSFAQTWRFRRMTAVTVAAFTIALAINGFISAQSFYWYAASIRHALPIAGSIAFFALVAFATRRRQCGDRHVAILALAGGAICFVNAGLSEPFALFQLLCVGIAFLASVFLVDRSENPRPSLVLGFGLLATAASLTAMATAPGVAIRMDALETITSKQNRDIITVALMSLGKAFLYLRDPELIKGFAAALALGLHLTLDEPRPATAETRVRPGPGLRRGPLLFALALQLLCMPLLLEQVSNDQLVLGRYSIGYSIVLLANLGFVISISLLLSMRSRVDRILARHQASSTSLGTLLLLAVLLATAVTQVRGVDWRVSTYIYLTLLALLVALSWQWSYSLPRSIARPAWIAILTLYAIAFVGTLSIIFVGQSVTGGVWVRILGFVPFVFIFPGLIWAVLLGQAILWLGGSSRFVAVSTLVLKLGSLIAVLIIGTGVFLEHARWIPSFQQYASDWSTREQEIIAARESGQRTVSVAPLSFDLESFLYIPKLDKQACPLQYYDVDAILIEDS